jgi:hypothetical protein
MKSMYKAGLTVGAVVIAAALFTSESLSGQQGGGAGQAPAGARGAAGRRASDPVARAADAARCSRTFPRLRRRSRCRR